MKISELLSKLIHAGLIPDDPHKAWEAFSEAVLTLDLQGQADFNDAATELFDSHAILLWSEFGGEGSPNVDRPSTAIARSANKPSPRMAIDMSSDQPIEGAGATLALLIETAIQRDADLVGVQVREAFTEMLGDRSLISALIEKYRPQIQAAREASAERELQAMIAVMGGGE